MNTHETRSCPLCGRTLRHGEGCACRGAEAPGTGAEHGDARSDFLDYLDDKVAPVLIQPSLSWVLNTSPGAPFSPADTALMVYNWACRKASRGGGAMFSHVISALGAIVKADQYGVLENFDGSVFYPMFILRALDMIPSEQVDDFRKAVKIHQEKVWEAVTTPADVSNLSDLSRMSAARDSQPVMSDPFQANIRSVLENPEGCDRLLEAGDTRMTGLFDELARGVRGVTGFDEITRRMTLMKRAAVKLFNAGQIMGAWRLAQPTDETLRTRNNDLMYRIVFEAASTRDISWDNLRLYLGDIVFHPFLAPFCRLFSEFAPGELLFMLLKEEDQSVRRMHYNLLKVYDKDIFPVLVEELEHPRSNPWYYTRNVISLVGEINSLDAAQKKRAFNAFSPFLAMDGRRQLAVACIHSLARLDGPDAESILVHILQTRSEESPEEGTETLSPLDFSFKVLEGLCMINTEKSIGEVVEIAMGKKTAVSTQHEAVQFYALDQLSKLDLNLFPRLRGRFISFVSETVAPGKFNFKKALFGRNVRMELAFLHSLRNTRSPDTRVIMQQTAEGNMPVELREEAQHILAEHSSHRELHPYSFQDDDGEDPPRR